MRHRIIALAASALVFVACTSPKVVSHTTAPTSSTSIKPPTYTLTAGDLQAARAFVQAALGLQVPTAKISYATSSQLAAASRQDQTKIEFRSLEAWLRDLRPLGLTDGQSLSAHEVLAAGAQGLGGLFRPAAPHGEVLLRQDLPPAAMRSVLVHELTHAVVDPLLGFEDDDLQLSRTGRGWTTLREFVPLWVEAKWQKALPEADRLAIAGAGVQVMNQQGTLDVPAAVIRALAAPGRTAGEMLSEVPSTWSGHEVLDAVRSAVARAPADMSVLRARYELLTPGASAPPGTADLDVGVVEELARKLGFDESVQGRVLGDEVLAREDDCRRWRVELRPGQWAGDVPSSTGDVQVVVTENSLVVTAC